MTRIKIRILKSAFIRVTASWALCPYRRPELVGFVPDDRASAALPAFAVAAPVAVPPVAVVVVRAELAVVAPVADALADPAHVASVVAAADDLHAALVDSAPVLIHDAFVVVAVAAEQLRVAALVAVVRVLRHVRPVAVVVALVVRHVQPAAHLLHVQLDAVRSVVVAAAAVAVVALCAALRVVPHLYHVAVEPPEAPVEPPVLTTFAPFAVHRAPVVHLSP